MAELPLDQAIPRFKTNEERIDTFVNGDENATYTTSGGVQVPSVRKVVADINEEGEGWLAQAEAASDAAQAAALALQDAVDAVAGSVDFLQSASEQLSISFTSVADQDFYPLSFDPGNQKLLLDRNGQLLTHGATEDYEVVTVGGVVGVRLTETPRHSGERYTYRVAQVIRYDPNLNRVEGFGSRASLVNHIATNGAVADRTYTDGKQFYRTIPIGHVLYGTDPIPDLPGLVPVGEWNARHFGAAVDDTTDDCAEIQAGINALHALGGGNLVIDGDVLVGFSNESDTFLKINGPGVPNSTSLATETACLVLRSGVTLVLQNGARVRSSSTTPSVIVAVDMNGGGVIGRGLMGRITSNWISAGAGHGILLNISEDGKDNINLTFDNLEIYGVGSYGIGAQTGDYWNNRYSNLYIHDTGADGIDHKVRNGSTNTSRGVTFENIIVQRHGRRSAITDSAGIDIRGPATLNNIWVLDHALGSQNNVGVRFSSATYDPESAREASSYSSLTNFYIDSGDPSVAGTDGLVLLSSTGTDVGFGTVRNCRGSGITVSDAASGVGDTSALSNIANVTVEACRDVGARVTSDKVNLTNVRVIGQVDPFSQDRGNLTIGQTVLNTPRPHDVLTVQVWKNGTQLTVTTDYAVTDADTITLAVAAANLDVFEVITPTVIGFDIDGADCGTSMCSVDHVTTPISIGSGADATYRPGVNRFGTGDVFTRGGTSPYIGVSGPGADYEIDVRSKGAGGVTLRSNGNRALRAVNPASAVNWVTIKGSIAGQPVKAEATGSDTNIDYRIEAKGAGIASLGNTSGTRQVQASSVGVGFFGTAPVAKPTGVAITAAGIHAALVTLGLIAS